MKNAYALCSKDFSITDGTLLFMPRDATKYLSEIYVSSEVADENGDFAINPTITIVSEIPYTFYGLGIKFRNVAVNSFNITTYKGSTQTNTTQIIGNTEINMVINDRFSDCDMIVIEFVKSVPHSRVTIDSISVGDATNYSISSKDMYSSPATTRLDKLKNISVKITEFTTTSDAIVLSTGKATVTPDNNTIEVILDTPCYNYSASVIGDSSVKATIKEAYSYYVVIEFSGLTGEKTVEYKLTGNEYKLSESSYTHNYDEKGSNTVNWKNPLVGDVEHAGRLEKWLASSYLANTEYDIDWRGDPRIDSGDYLIMDKGDKNNLLVKIKQNELSFNGAWRGKITARKVIKQ